MADGQGAESAGLRVRADKMRKARKHGHALRGRPVEYGSISEFTVRLSTSLASILAAGRSFHSVVLCSFVQTGQQVQDWLM